MKGIKKRIIIFLCVISVFVGSFAVPLKVKAVVGEAVVALTLGEILTYVISGIVAVGATVGLNELLDSDEEMYSLVNHYLSESSGIVIDESRGTVVKDEQEISIQDWIDGLGTRYGSQMADQKGDSFLDKLNNMDLRMKYDREVRDLVDIYILNEHDQEALGTDKVYITEEEYQELLYALYLKNHGLLKEETEDITPTVSPSPDNDNNKHKLDWKALAVSSATIPIAALAVGGKTFWNNVSDFFNELFTDENAIADYPSLSTLYNSNSLKYTGDYELIGDKYLYRCFATSLDNGYMYTYEINETSMEKVAGYESSGTYGFIGTIGSSHTLFDFMINEKIYDSSGKLLADRYNDWSSLGRNCGTNISCNFPIFATMQEAIDFVMGNIDDSKCINKEKPKFTYAHLLNNSSSLKTTLEPLNNIPGTMGLSSLSLQNYAQDILDNQDTLKSEPDEFSTLIMPKINSLVDSADDIEISIESDDDENSGENEDISPGGGDTSDEDFEVLTTPEPMPLPFILPFTIPSVAEKVKGPSDFEYNYSPFFIAIISILMVDFETVKKHATESFDKLPPLEGTQAIFDSINIIADSVNDEIAYPVISIDTPDILYQFYPYGEIVLCDTSEYARFFSFVRSALSVSLAIGFVMWLLMQLKITLSIN